MIWFSFKRASIFFCFCCTVLYDFSVFVFFYIYCMFPCVALDLPAMYEDSTCIEAIFFLSFEHLLDTLTFIHIVMRPQKWIDFRLLSAAFSIYVNTTSEVQQRGQKLRALLPSDNLYYLNGCSCLMYIAVTPNYVRVPPSGQIQMYKKLLLKQIYLFDSNIMVSVI